MLLWRRRRVGWKGLWPQPEGTGAPVSFLSERVAAVQLRFERPWQYGFLSFAATPWERTAVVRLEARPVHGVSAQTFEARGAIPQGNIVFNTYCLADGEYDLFISVTPAEHEPETAVAERSPEAECDTLRCRIEVLNGDTELARSLRHEAGLRRAQALLLNGIDSRYFSDYPPPLNHPFFPRLSRDKLVLRRLRRQDLASFDSQGCLLLPAFLDAASIEPARQALIEASRDPGRREDQGMRYHNPHQSLAALEAIYADAQLYDVVSDLLGYQAYPCQSFAFVKGPNQGSLQDAIHLTSFPRGMMCGLLIALQDFEPDCGEFYYYPGSHLLEPVLCSSHAVPKVDPRSRDYRQFGLAYNQAIAALLAENPQVQRQAFRGKAGDVLIWHQNLIHGDSPPQRAEATRLSMVIHAFAEGAYMYFDASGTTGRRDWPFRATPPGRPVATQERSD